MKKFFFITVFFSLISFEVNSQEILISGKGDKIWDYQGYRDYSSGITYKLNLRKKYWVPAKFQGKPKSHHKLIITDDYFYNYSLDQYYEELGADKATIMYKEISRVDGYKEEYLFDIPVSEHKKLEKKIKSLNKVAKVQKVRELVRKKLVSYTGVRLPKQWIYISANCSKTKKKF